MTTSQAGYIALQGFASSPEPTFKPLREYKYLVAKYVAPHRTSTIHKLRPASDASTISTEDRWARSFLV